MTSATTSIPQSRRRRFFDDLVVRLTSPDQLAIEQRGRTIQIASSRAPRVTIVADGREHIEPGSTTNHTIRTRAVLSSSSNISSGDRLVVSGSGRNADKFYISFDPVDGGSRLRVTRRIYAEHLSRPIVVRSIYNKVSEIARWPIYDEPPPPSLPSRLPIRAASTTAKSESAIADEKAKVNILRAELDRWIASTNKRDIEGQLSFYLPRVAAFYLARDVSREAVRREKERIFGRARTVEINVNEPEIIFRDSGQTAIMRFRKQYRVEGDVENRRGEVIQELGWQQTKAGWKIFSERDVQVLR